MKAKVKATGEIVDVVANSFYYESIKDERIFDGSELEIISKTKDPDYWTRLKHQYAGMAMQGIISNEDYLQSFSEDARGDLFEDIARVAADIAHALVEKMKEERK